MAKYYQKTVESQTKSGAIFQIDSYKYRVVSTKIVGKSKVGNHIFYKYKIKYTDR